MSDSEHEPEDDTDNFTVHTGSVIIQTKGKSFVFGTDQTKTSDDDKVFLRIQAINSSTRRLITSLIDSKVDPSTLMKHVEIVK